MPAGYEAAQVTSTQGGGSPNLAGKVDKVDEVEELPTAKISGSCRASVFNASRPCPSREIANIKADMPESTARQKSWK